MKGIEQPPEFHPEGDVFIHTLKMLGLLRDASITLAWGALLHDVGKPLTMERRERITFYQHDRVGAEVADEVLRRLKFSNAQREKICALVLNHLRFIDVQNMRLSTLKRFLRIEDFDEHLELHRLDCLASHGDLDNHRFCLERLKTLDDVRKPVERILTGDDLIGLGYRPGPRFKQILSAVEDEQLENRLKRKEEAIAYVKTAFPLNVEDSGVA
jgi:poly(A) polymerase